MAGQITQVGLQYRATCTGGCARPLDWKVGTREHAQHVLAKHVREHHPDEVPAAVIAAASDTPPDVLAGLPETFNVSLAASMLLAILGSETIGGDSATAAAARSMWECLTGLRGESAIEAASIAADRDVTAVRAPF